MSTATVETLNTTIAPTAPNVSPGISSFLAMFSTYAVIAAATVTQEKADATARDHVAEVTDGMTGIAAGLAQAKPAWSPDIQASLVLVQTFLPVFVNLFRKKA